ncbi:exodeoxyribonuclease VII small subunit [Aeromicrobium sp.]|uniref:exodeoxyribonuclease VII small subunit n=1 Tax=Aeromicrobium sp. TaxID=1871063 RepID=UPI0019B14D84|nr:exodeoxyribonuclease VII small subunit [Aeromicrobium sp.]MBC7633483.1 exodeoxyribonuclease VII small subunit [Aeromicrobium sp.]
MADAAPTPDIPYEQARDELIAVVQKLEVGGTSLDESLALWERGELLATICQQWLDGARSRLAAAAEAGAPAHDVDNDAT